MIDGTARAELLAVDGANVRRVTDAVAVERALEIRVVGTGPVVTMRTPGHDMELVAGLLLSEGLVRQPRELLDIRHWAGEDVVVVIVDAPASATRRALSRSSLATSACGVCGKDKLDLSLLGRAPRLAAGPRVDATTLLALPHRLRVAQGVFEATGGLHAAALFNASGELVALREDVGRHNALDKLTGWALRAARLPLAGHIVMLSGRASFELLQKAIMAGVPIVCAVSAPSSFAVDLAKAHGVTLVGFLRGQRFNVYSHPERIADIGDLSGSDEPSLQAEVG